MRAQPDLSIVIPTRSRPFQLRRCLQSIAASRFSRHQLEVVVVDDGSDAPPRDIVGNVQHALSIRLVCSDHRGPAAARNLGARAARGRFLLFIDDDCTVMPTTLEMATESARTHASAMIAGRWVNGLPWNPYAAANQDVTDYLHRICNASLHDARFMTSNAVVIPRALFLDSGGFDEAFSSAGGEDRELCDRWRSQGRRAMFTPGLTVRHSHDLDLAGYLRQQFNYGTGAYLFRAKAATMRSASLRLETPLFYQRLILFPFSNPQQVDPFRRALLLALSQLAILFGFCWQWWEQRREA